jgi:threonine/homoserine/homoserine lactone efflux protein
VIELAAIFGGSFVLALSGVMTPGPILTATVAESVHRGFRAGPLMMIGHALLELLLVVAIIQGLARYLKSPPVMGIIALVGGGVLVWLGVGMVRKAGGLSLKQATMERPAKRTPHPVVLGVLTSLSNPYWTLWWATIGLGYLVAAMKYGAAGLVVFFLGHISADFLWYSLVSYGVSRGKTLLRDRGYQIMIQVCGLFLLAFGAWFLLTAKGYLTQSGPL